MSNSRRHSIKSLKEYWEGQDYDESLENYLDQLCTQTEISQLYSVGQQYIYLLNTVNSTLPYLSSSISQVLGYNAEEITHIDFLYDIIHVEDHDLVVRATEKGFDFCFKYQYTKPFEYTWNMDYRVRKADGNYIRINRQTTIFKRDRKGNVVLTLGVCTDITHIKKSGNMAFYLDGPDKTIINFPDKELLKIKNDLTSREIDVLQLIIEGKSSKEIAIRLCISKATVDTHRRNMKKKLGAGSTADLVMYGIDHGIA